MSQIFLILAHKNPAQLKRLVDKLTYPGAKFVVHIDASCEIDDFKSHFNNTPSEIFFLADRVLAKWGTFQIIEATLNGLQFILENLPDVERVTLMSGQDYPIKPIRQILSFFRNNNNIYIEYSPVPYKHWWNGGINRFPLFDEISKMIKIYGGSQWWSIPIGEIKKMLSDLKEYPDFIVYFQKVNIPDESFFQTLLFNSEEESFKERGVNDSLRLIFWCPPYMHPNILRAKNFGQLLHSKKFFARKFDDGVDDAILDMIDETLLDNTKAKIKKKILNHKKIDYSEAVLMLSNNMASIPRFDKLKEDLAASISLNPFLLFHQTDDIKLNTQGKEEYFVFDNSILSSLGFEPLEKSLLPGSNHFPLFSFFHAYPSFDYYWIIEDDVFFNGDWRYLFKAFDPRMVNADFISSHIRHNIADPNWYWWNTLSKKGEPDTVVKEKIASFNPIYRISRDAIMYLEKKMKDGWIGHHETLISTLLYNAGFTILDFGGTGKFCYNKRKNLFYKDNICSLGSKIHHSTMRYRPLITKEELSEPLLYHPVKY